MTNQTTDAVVPTTLEEAFIQEAGPAVMNDPGKLQHYLDRAAELQLPDLAAVCGLLGRLAAKVEDPDFAPGL